MPNHNARQCRERHNNYLKPSLRHDPWTAEEDRLLVEKAEVCGSKWNTIATFFTNRSGNSLRNRWHMIQRYQNRCRANPQKRSATRTEPFSLTPATRSASSEGSKYARRKADDDRARRRESL
jgi:myb proto-oncogene protein